MQTLYIIIMGIFQGLSEFLPISSSGHLVILQRFFQLEEGGLFLNLVLHTGTLGAVIIYFFKDIKKLFFSFKYSKNPMLYWLILANVPTAAIGLVIKHYYTTLSTIWIVGAMLIATGILLLIIKNHQEQDEALTTKRSFIIGAVQGLAALPGISRSGSTIATSFLLKIDKETAFKFSFLLSIPAILGADLLEFKDFILGTKTVTLSFWALTAGFSASFITGMAALVFLRKMIQANKFHYFAYYCFGAGILAILGGVLL